MGILNIIEDPEAWEQYYENKAATTMSEREQKELRAFIDEQAYLPVVNRIRSREPFPHARRIEISKMGTAKKRIVYTYPNPEKQVCKMLTWHLIRRYDSLFAPNLYSFRSNHGVKEAIHYYTTRPKIEEMYSYKADISNYFNSVPLDTFLPELQAVMKDDPEGFEFLKTLLTDPIVLWNDVPMEEDKGLMAGIPQASFYANLYLKDIDQYFYENHILYARYSDDILIFAETEEQLQAHRDHLHRELQRRGLTLNPDKEEYHRPHEPWTFLGFICQDGEIDICPVSVEKLKAKIRRKRRALERWQKRHQVSNEKTARAFIRAMNRKLFENDALHELTWVRWFCPLITTTESLRLLDHYMEENIRYIASGTKTKSRYNITYQDLKDLGFRSLVHEYYADWTEQ